MKNYLVVTLGAHASGKSTFLKKKNLENYVISPDKIRLLFSAPIQKENGYLTISNGKEKIVAELIKDAIIDRVAKGEFTIIDDTNTRPKKWKEYQDLCNEYGVELICLDFRNENRSELIMRDKLREEYKKVGSELINRDVDRLENLVLPKQVKVLKPEQWDEYFAFEYQDLNKYKKIHHFGDIHGCFEPLNEYLKDGIKNDEFYIFVGDYIDRGIQNAEVLEFLFTIKGLSNVVMLEGNHEFPLRKWAKNSTTNSEIFNVYTKKEIEKKNISKKKVNLILSTLKTFFAYEYDEKKVLVNHGGITKIPKTKYEIPAEQMIRGVGNYEFNVDGAFTENSNENEYQLHGHRNIYKVPSFASKNSYNLEFGVEKGGCLRVMTLNNKGFESIEIKNNVFSDRYENKKEIKCSSK